MFDFSKKLGINCVSSDTIKQEEDYLETGLVIGDGHDDHRLDKNMVRVAGERAVDKRHNFIVFIGDLATFDSCNAHDKNDTLKGKEKPNIFQDIESLKEAISAFILPIRRLQEKQRKNKEKIYKPHIVITLGNHEDRLRRFIERNPELDGFWDTVFLPIFAKAGIEVVDYTKYFKFNDMYYTHVPLNPMGKPYGGVNMGRTIALNALTNITHGHKHESYEYIQTKINPGDCVDGIHIICTGAYLPTGYREPYAENSQAYWTSYLHEQTFVNGKYISTSKISLQELELLYK